MKRFWSPPGIQIRVAWRSVAAASGAVNTSLAALFAPASSHIFTEASPASASPEAWGSTATTASLPPASSSAFATISGPVLPPPTTMRGPLAAAARTGTKTETRRNARSRRMRRFYRQRSLQVQQLGFDAVSHRPEGAVGAPQCLLSRRVDQVMAAAAAAALRRRHTDVGRDHLLLFEPAERHVDRADRGVAPGALDDFTADRRAVGAVPQPHQRQQHEMLEFADDRRVIILR